MLDEHIELESHTGIMIDAQQDNSLCVTVVSPTMRYGNEKGCTKDWYSLLLRAVVVHETMQVMSDSKVACICVVHRSRIGNDCSPKVTSRQIAVRQGGLALRAPYDDCGLEG